MERGVGLRGQGCLPHRAFLSLGLSPTSVFCREEAAEHSRCLAALGGGGGSSRLGSGLLREKFSSSSDRTVFVSKEVLGGS